MAVEPGLCASCSQARVVRGAGSVFWLCERSRTDARFPRYPRLPVRRCPGYEPQSDKGGPKDDEALLPHVRGEVARSAGGGGPISR
jgi:hypothetical protein